MPMFIYEAARTKKDDDGIDVIDHDTKVKYEIEASSDNEAEEKGIALLNEEIKNTSFSLDDYVFGTRQK